MAQDCTLFSAFTFALLSWATCDSRALPETWDQFLGSNRPVFPSELNENFLKTGGLSQSYTEKNIVLELQTILNHPQISAIIYSNFLSAYKKDQSRRLQSVFIKNVMKIARQNILYHAKKSSWSEKINFAADMTDQEFSDFVGKGPENKVSAAQGTHDHSSKTNKTNPADVPDSLDWREFGYVSPVQYQGSCGSCGAFSSVSAVELAIAVSTGGESKPVLSVEQLVDCFGTGCNGVNPDEAMQYIIKNGLALDSDYPYTAADSGESGECQKHPVVGKISNYSETTDEQEMKRVVATVGPAVIGIYFSMDMYRQNSGIYDGPCGEKDGQPANHHAVTIVGHGHSEDDNMDYWILKNSHGTDCCDQGYIKLRRSVDKCGVSSYFGAVIPIV